MQCKGKKCKATPLLSQTPRLMRPISANPLAQLLAHVVMARSLSLFAIHAIAECRACKCSTSAITRNCGLIVETGRKRRAANQISRTTPKVYFAKAAVQRKRPGTLQNEKQAIGRWKSSLGHVRIDRITTPRIAAFIDKRMKGAAFGGRELEPVWSNRLLAQSACPLVPPGRES